MILVVLFSLNSGRVVAVEKHVFFSFDLLINNKVTELDLLSPRSQKEN